MARPVDGWWRLRWAAIGAVIACLVIAATWGVARLVRTPQDLLAAASAPPPSQITFPISRRTLQADLVLSGQLTAADTVSGSLTVDQRSQTANMARILVTVPSQEIPARLGAVTADGRFTLKLATPVPDRIGTYVRIHFVSRNRSISQLTVPISALFTTPAGETAVVVVRHQSQQQVTVRLGLTADGYIGITPVGQSLAAGDLVLVSEPGP